MTVRVIKLTLTDATIVGGTTEALHELQLSRISSAGYRGNSTDLPFDR